MKHLILQIFVVATFVGSMASAEALQIKNVVYRGFPKVNVSIKVENSSLSDRDIFDTTMRSLREHYYPKLGSQGLHAIDVTNCYLPLNRKSCSCDIIIHPTKFVKAP